MSLLRHPLFVSRNVIRIGLLTTFALLLFVSPLQLRAEDLSKAGPLASYVKKADDTFTSKKRDEGKIGATEYVELIITSQTWKGTTWKHLAFLLKPSSATKENKHALLMITGGSWRDEIETSPPENLPREATILASAAE